MWTFTANVQPLILFVNLLILPIFAFSFESCFWMNACVCLCIFILYSNAYNFWFFSTLFIRISYFIFLPFLLLQPYPLAFTISFEFQLVARHIKRNIILREIQHFWSIKRFILTFNISFWGKEEWNSKWPQQIKEHTL